MEYELLKSFCLGVQLSQYVMDHSLEGDIMPNATTLLRQIADGDFTLYDSPEDESQRHLANIVVKNDREIAAKIVKEMGPEISKS